MLFVTAPAHFTQENWYIQPAAIFKWFAAMATLLEPERLERYLMHILAPVYRITEENVIKDSHLGTSSMMFCLHVTLIPFV